jgi:hypothetical protein
MPALHMIYISIKLLIYRAYGALQNTFEMQSHMFNVLIIVASASATASAPSSASTAKMKGRAHIV